MDVPDQNVAIHAGAVRRWPERGFSVEQEPGKMPIARNTTGQSSVNLELVWKTVEVEIPRLAEAVKRLLGSGREQ